MTDEDDVSDASPQPLTFPLPDVPASQGPPSIPFTMLLDFAIQKTYHELSVLVELSLKKSDLERKIGLVQFAFFARQLFIRLLAVVKWVRSGTKFDVCTAITCYLDQQASMFTETSDRLYQLSKDSLPQALLPSFQIPVAVDILSMGKYLRLPICIKNRFISEELATPKEQRCVLNRLNQVVENRLFSVVKFIPKPMRNFMIKSGMVKFHVPGEFEVTATLLGQRSSTSWTLLDLKMLVQDCRLGDGGELLHTNQLAVVKQLLDSRLVKVKNPINDLYDVLHSFCLALQLDIICCQAAQMISDQSNENMSIEEYAKGQRLVIGYWKEHLSSSGAKQQRERAGAKMGGETKALPAVSHKLVVCASRACSTQLLQVQHVPPSDRVDMPSSISGQHLSLENLLADTVLIRIKCRLQQLKERVESCLRVRCQIVGQLPSLRVFLVEPCSESEVLYFIINFFTGRFISDLPVLKHSPVFDELDRLLNRAAWSRLRGTLVNLRTLIIMNRFARMASRLPFHVVDRLPLLTESFTAKVLTGHHLFLRLMRYDGYYVILQFKQEDDGSVTIHYYLLTTAAVDALPLLFPKSRPITVGCACELLKPVNLIKLDPWTIGRYGESSRAMDHRSDFNYISELNIMFMICEQRIPFMMLIEALNIRGVAFQTSDNGDEGCMFLYITGIMTAMNIKRSLFKRFWDTVLSCCVRLTNDKNRVHWTFEFVFCNVPVQGVRHWMTGDDVADQSQTKMVVLNYRVSAENALKCVDEFLNTVHTFAALYEPVRCFAPFYRAYGQQYVKVLTYTYYKLTLGYGPSKAFAVTVQWRHNERAFVLTFGVYDRSCSLAVKTNPHCWMAALLQQMFNEHRNLEFLSKLLHESISALTAIQRLPEMLVHGLTDHLGQTFGIGHLFCVIPLNVTTVHIIYKGLLCLEVVFLTGDFVGLRDCGALAHVPAQKHTTRYLPIVGLKSFLNLHEKMDKCQKTLQAPYDAIQKSPYVRGEFADSLAKCYLENKTSSPVPFSLQSSGAGIGAVNVSAMPPVMSPAIISSSQTIGGSSMSPSPLSHSGGGVGLLTPSPAPASNGSLLMNLSPNSFSQTSPGPITTQPILSPANVTSPFATVMPSMQPTSLTTDADQEGGDVPGRDMTVFSPPEDWTPSVVPIVVRSSVLNQICSESGCRPKSEWSHLQKFLASIVILERFKDQNMGTWRPGQVNIKSNVFDFKLYIEETSLSHVLVRLTRNETDICSEGDVRLLEHYFSAVISPTYQQNAVTSFLRLLSACRAVHPGLLESFMAIMRCQLGIRPEEGAVWSVHLCPIIPPLHLMSTSFATLGKSSVQPGNAAIIVNVQQKKMLFWLRFCRLSDNSQQYVFPFVFDGENNLLQIFKGPGSQQHGQYNSLSAMEGCLFRHHQNNQNYGDCSIWRSARDLLRLPELMVSANT